MELLLLLSYSRNQSGEVFPCVSQLHCNEYLRLGDLNCRHTSHSSGGWKYKMEAPTVSVLGESSGLIVQAPSLCPHIVTEPKGFATWGALFKNRMGFWQGSFISLQQVRRGDTYPKFCLQEGGLAIVSIHYLVNYMLISSLQLDTFNLLSSRQLILFTAASAKYCAIF